MNNNIKEFNGFSPDFFSFLSELSQNNNKLWFDNNRDIYKNIYLPTAFSFIHSLGSKLSKRIPTLNCLPKINHSLFRINRDARFSKNKNPYKTSMSVFMWDGALDSKNQNPGFYFEISPFRIILATGAWYFETKMLEVYREAISKISQNEFLNIVTRIEQEQIPVSSLPGMYVRVPKTFQTKNEKINNFLKYKGITASIEIYDKPEFVENSDFIDYCVGFCYKTIDLFFFIRELTYKAVKN